MTPTCVSRFRTPRSGQCSRGSGRRRRAPATMASGCPCQRDHHHQGDHAGRSAQPTVRRRGALHAFLRQGRLARPALRRQPAHAPQDAEPQHLPRRRPSRSAQARRHDSPAPRSGDTPVDVASRRWAALGYGPWSSPPASRTLRIASVDLATAPSTTRPICHTALQPTAAAQATREDRLAFVQPVRPLGPRRHHMSRKRRQRVPSTTTAPS